MEKVTKRFFSDAGHGWLSVKNQELLDLGIGDMISKYSYVNGKSAYLEEDVDMSLYVKAMEDSGVSVEFDQRDHGEYSRIRKYEPFPSQVIEESSESEVVVEDQISESVSESVSEVEQEVEQEVLDVFERELAA